MRKVPLIAQLVVALAVGCALGLVLGKRAEVLGELGTLVIKLLKALATPLVFVAIVDSLCRAEIPAKKGLQLLLTCVVNAAVAGAIAMALSSLIRPGEGFTLPAAKGEKAPDHVAMDPIAALKGLVPESAVEPFLKNNVLAVVVLAVLFGIALRRLRAHGRGETVFSFVEETFELLTLILEWVVRIVPLAVLGVIAKVVGSSGFGIFASLGKLVGTVALGLAIHVFVYYAILVRTLGKTSPVKFFRAAGEALATAMSTGSSLATLPVTLRTLEKRLDVSHENARLAACVGTNFNNDGIMLYEVAAALFIAQLHGIHLDVPQKIQLAVTSALAAAGIAGVPEAGLITLALVLGSVGLPLTELPVLLTVDWLLGRLRASTNVSSDLVIATVLDRSHPFGKTRA